MLPSNDAAKYRGRVGRQDLNRVCPLSRIVLTSLGSMPALYQVCLSF